MYKIGDQRILLKEIFSIERPVFDADKNIMYVNIYSKSGAKVRAEFFPLKTDDCSTIGAPCKIFRDRSIKEIELLIKEVEKLQA